MKLGRVPRRRLPRTCASESSSVHVAPKPRRFGLPSVEFPQAQARERRRKRLQVQYGADFDLVGEVSDIAEPLAGEVSEVLSGPITLRDRSRDDKPLALRPEVEAIAEAVHGLRAKVIELLAGDKQLSTQARARLAAGVGAGVPEVTDEQLRSGAWVNALTAHVGPLAGDLAALLGRSAAAVGCVSPASERLVEALRLLDRAALDLARRIPKVRERRDFLAVLPAREVERKARWERERRARELARLKLVTPPAQILRGSGRVHRIVVEGISR
jgi:hypothetical protein